MNTFIPLFLLHAATLGTDELRTFNAVKHVEIRNGSGSIRIGASSDDSATLRSRLVHGRCTPEIAFKDGALSVSVEGSRCEIELTLTVPKAAALDLGVGSGDVSITGMSGTLKLNTGSGDIAVDAPLGETEIKTGSGDIKLSGLVSSARVKSGSGDLDVRYQKLPKSGELSFKTGSGDAQVSFPKGSEVAVDFSSGSGELRDRLGIKEGAAFVLRARSGSGDLVVAAY